MQDESEVKREKSPDVARENWDAEQISEESTNKSSDDIVREMLRGDESEGNADNRDVVGGVKSEDTPQGREETK